MLPQPTPPKVMRSDGAGLSARPSALAGTSVGAAIAALAVARKRRREIPELCKVFIIPKSSHIPRPEARRKREEVGAAPVHRDPPQPVYRLRKIQCISQRTWNGLRVWLQRPRAPWPPRGEGGPRGARRERILRHKNRKWWTAGSHVA